MLLPLVHNSGGPWRAYCVWQVRDMDQATRDAVGTLLLRVTLRELFLWRFMQVRVV
jgi:hypothetical protein